MLPRSMKRSKLPNLSEIRQYRSGEQVWGKQVQVWGKQYETERRLLDSLSINLLLIIRYSKSDLKSIYYYRLLNQNWSYCFNSSVCLYCKIQYFACDIGKKYVNLRPPIKPRREDLSTPRTHREYNLLSLPNQINQYLDFPHSKFCSTMFIRWQVI